MRPIRTLTAIAVDGSLATVTQNHRHHHHHQQHHHHHQQHQQYKLKQQQKQRDAAGAQLVEQLKAAKTSNTDTIEVQQTKQQPAIKQLSSRQSRLKHQSGQVTWAPPPEAAVGLSERSEPTESKTQASATIESVASAFRNNHLGNDEQDSFAPSCRNLRRTQPRQQQLEVDSTLQAATDTATSVIELPPPIEGEGSSTSAKVASSKVDDYSTSVFGQQRSPDDESDEGAKQHPLGDLVTDGSTVPVGGEHDPTSAAGFGSGRLWLGVNPTTSTSREMIEKSAIIASSISSSSANSTIDRKRLNISNTSYKGSSSSTGNWSAHSDRQISRPEEVKGATREANNVARSNTTTTSLISHAESASAGQAISGRRRQQHQSIFERILYLMFNFSQNSNSNSNITTAANATASEHSLPVALVLGVIILVTFVGNVLVCLSVIKVRKLRNPANYLLISLAISDLCVACVVMPFGLYSAINKNWQLGKLLCNIYVVSDITSCTASILNLCVISIDRYLAITRPLTYCAKRTTRLMMILIAFVWICACLISVPPLLISGNEHGNETEPICEPSQEEWYQVYATCISFYIPLIVMICLYYNIYTAAKRVVEAEQRATTGLSSLKKQALANNNGSNGGANSLLAVAELPKAPSSVMRERKASITLGVIMSAFTICWLPFFILALLRPFSAKIRSLPQTVFVLALWLGYANSLLNPIIYVTFHHDFRNAFKHLLCLRCMTINEHIRKDEYRSQYGGTHYHENIRKMKNQQQQ